jgi:hypothetical protein
MKQLRKHVVTTGTGRCGTTFLVELFTNLGFDTGFSKDELSSKKNKVARAGLEFDIRSENCPFIVKSPFFCDYAKEIVHRDDIAIEHVFIPIRDLNAAAESRRYVVQTAVSGLPLLKRLKHLVRPRKIRGGLWNTNSSKPGIQEEILLGQIYKLMLAISDTTIPVTFLRYPRIVKDCRYLFEKLEPMVRDIPYESFCAVFKKTARPELAHCFNQNDR